MQGAGDELAQAILRTVAYSDVFDFPLTNREIHRYLVGVRADRSSVDYALGNGALVPEALTRNDGYWMLKGRERLLDVRRRREERSRALWRYATQYGRLIAGLPFVRMVAVTGELAVDNIRGDSDIDFFIVTEPGRLWLTRAMVIGIVKAAGRRGIEICPNYLVSENALHLDARNLYAAREMAQMVPISGRDIYERIRRCNDWVTGYLPNASGPPRQVSLDADRSRLQPLSEWLLRNPLGDRAESWEMNRKIRKFSRDARPGEEVAFSADWCKGHFDSHGAETLEAYAERLSRVEGLLQ